MSSHSILAMLVPVMTNSVMRAVCGCLHSMSWGTGGGFRHPAQRWGLRHVSAGILSLAILAPLGLGTAQAAQLTVQEGVVVKFGENAQLVVRDKLLAQGASFTSRKDDSIGGQTNAAPQTPAVGDWQGVRIEKSSAAYGASTLGNLSLRYAGNALTVRGVNSSLPYLKATDSTVGLRLLDGASPAVSGASFLRNGTGIEADGNSAPSIGSSHFSQNSVQAVLNKTPATIIQAAGNWWGHNSGPKDPVANPLGQGDLVSTGVNYGSFLTTVPLINPMVKLTAPAAYFTGPTVAVEASCVNASEYRLAEGNAFSGVPFQSMTDGRASVQFAVSAGDGQKTLTAQFRNPEGVITSASLSGGFLIDTQPPTLQIANPAEGSVVSQPIRVEATASDASGIARVDIYLNGTKVATRTAAPYAYDWDTSASADGVYVIRLVAVDAAGRTTEAVRNVTLTHVPVPPDTQGPSLSNVAFGGNGLVNGTTLSRSGTLTLNATDPSGISSVRVLLSGTEIATASGSANYSAVLNLNGVANGNYTLEIQATDSLGNVTAQSYTVVVAHAVPNAPVLTAPQNGLVTRTVSQTVAGTAQANSSVQIILNGQAAGAPVMAASDGRFSGALTLVAGENLIQATATDTYGTSTPSAAVKVTVDLEVPASPGGLTAAAQIAGKVRLNWSAASDAKVVGYDLYRSSNAFSGINEAVKVNGARLTGTAYDDLPPQDGTWYYRLVSVNAAGTASVPTNQAQALSDATLPKAITIVYSPQGKVDTATGRTGQGRVDLVARFSEALQTVPYLAIVPQGGTPIVIELTKSADAEYKGSFQIDGGTPSGLASAILSARDLVGNRGTEIGAGATFNIDTQGPILGAIELIPGAPIKNDTAQTVRSPRQHRQRWGRKR